MVVHVSVDCVTVVSSRMLAVISVESVCSVLDFNTSSCVSGDDGVPDAVDCSDDFPPFVLDCMAFDANGFVV